MSSIPKPWYMRALEASYEKPTPSKLDVIDSRMYNLSHRISSLPPIFTREVMDTMNDLITNPALNGKYKNVINEDLMTRWKQRVHEEYFKDKEKRIIKNGKLMKKIEEKREMSDSAVGRVGDGLYYQKFEKLKRNIEDTDNQRSIYSDIDEEDANFEEVIQKAVLDNDQFKVENVFITEIGRSKTTDKFFIPFSNQIFQKHPRLLLCFDKHKACFDKNKLKRAYFSLKREKVKKQGLSESLEEIWREKDPFESLKSKRLVETKPEKPMTESRKKIRGKLRHDFKDLKQLQNRILLNETAPASQEGIRQKFTKICTYIHRTYKAIDKLEEKMYNDHNRDKSRETSLSEIIESRNRNRMTPKQLRELEINKKQMGKSATPKREKSDKNNTESIMNVEEVYSRLASPTKSIKSENITRKQPRMNRNTINVSIMKTSKPLDTRDRVGSSNQPKKVRIDVNDIRIDH